MSSIAAPRAAAEGAGPDVLRAAGWGLVVVVVQLLAVWLSSWQPDPVQAYRRLLYWDGSWYYKVVVEGYHSPPEPTAQHYGNVGFFPGYPLAAAALARLTGLEVWVALPLTAQLCAWGFWVYLLLLCRHWGVPPGLARTGALLLAVQPAAFFLVAAYSESLFLLALLGFVYWTERPGPWSAPLAALHGYALTATRLVGLPVVIYPLLRLWLRHDWRRPNALADALRQSAGPLLVAAAASLGALSYFAYCHFQLGHWDLYMKTQAAGWHVKPNPWALFSTRLLHVGHPNWRRGVDPDFLSRGVTLLLALAFVALPALEAWLALRRGERSWRERAPRFAAAFLLFWAPVCGYWWDHFRSMIRYALPVLALLTPALLHLLARRGVVALSRPARLLLTAAAALSALLQLGLACRFMHAAWVA
jgi:hypothetical protein